MFEQKATKKAKIVGRSVRLTPRFRSSLKGLLCYLLFKLFSSRSSVSPTLQEDVGHDRPEQQTYDNLQLSLGCGASQSFNKFIGPLAFDDFRFVDAVLVRVAAAGYLVCA
jgi:hypothetical protein